MDTPNPAQALPASLDPRAETRAWTDAGEAARREDLARIYQAHARAILDHVHRRTGDAHLAEDVAAEVFVRAYERLDDLRDGDRARAWLFRVASNLVNRWARWRRVRGWLRAEDSELAPIGPERDDDVSGEQAARVRAALLALPPRYQSVLALHYLEGLTVAEIAAVLACAEGTVNSRLSRGRDRLRRKLETRNPR